MCWSIADRLFRQVVWHLARLLDVAITGSPLGAEKDTEWSYCGCRFVVGALALDYTTRDATLTSCAQRCLLHIGTLPTLSLVGDASRVGRQPTLLVSAVLPATFACWLAPLDVCVRVLCFRFISVNCCLFKNVFSVH